MDDEVILQYCYYMAIFYNEKGKGIWTDNWGGFFGIFLVF